MGFMERTAHLPVCIGIDVSKDTLDVAGSDGGLALQFENKVQGWRRLGRHIHTVCPSLVVVEASGGYQEGAVQYLHQKGLCPIAVVNPKNVRDFARAQGILAKTDRLDAKVLARFGQVMNPRIWEPRAQKVEELDVLVKRREQLVLMQAIEKTRLAAAMKKGIQKSIEQHIQYLESEIQTLQKSIQEAMNQVDLKEKSDLLQSMSGIGPTTASVLITRLPELGEWEAKSLAAIVGLAPYSWDSGRLRGQRHIRGGRSDVRKALYMATVAAIRHNPIVQVNYKRMVTAGKPPKVAMTACMRKILVMLNAMLRDRKPFQSPQLGLAT
jgi:transposase